MALLITQSVKMNGIYYIGCVALCAASFMMTGCDNRTPVEKANELVSKSSVNLSHFETLDSVMGYKQAFSCRMAANNMQREIDAIEWKHRTEKRLLNADERKRCLELSDEIYKLSIEAAKIEMKAGLEKKPKEFVGYASPMMADSLSNDTIYTIYFDKDVTKIASVERKVLGL